MLTKHIKDNITPEFLASLGFSYGNFVEGQYDKIINMWLVRYDSIDHEVLSKHIYRNITKCHQLLDILKIIEDEV